MPYLGRGRGGRWGGVRDGRGGRGGRGGGRGATWPNAIQVSRGRGRGRGSGRGRGPGRGHGPGRGVVTWPNAIQVSRGRRSGRGRGPGRPGRPGRGDSRQQQGDQRGIATAPNSIPIMATDQAPPHAAGAFRYQPQAGNHITSALFPPNDAHAAAGAASSSRHAGSSPSASSSPSDSDPDPRLHPNAHPAHRQGEEEQSHEGVGYDLAALDNNNTGAPAAAALAARLTRAGSTPSAFGDNAEPTRGADWFPRDNNPATPRAASNTGVFGAPFTRRAAPSKVQPNALAVGDDNATRGGPSHEGTPDTVTRSNRGNNDTSSSGLGPINKNFSNFGEGSSDTSSSSAKPTKRHLELERRIEHPRLLPTNAPILGTVHEDIVKDPGTYVNKFQFDKKFVQRVQDYIHPQGRLSHLKEVFEWWFSRVLDRLDRKLSNEMELELDPHETVICKLREQLVCLRELGIGNKAKYDHYPVINYYATFIVPARGFSTDQIRIAQSDPKRWIRRDKRERKLLEQDPTGALLEKQKAENQQRSKEYYAKVHEEMEKAEEERRKAEEQRKMAERAKVRKALVETPSAQEVRRVYKELLAKDKYFRRLHKDLLAQHRLNRKVVKPKYDRRTCVAKIISHRFLAYKRDLKF
jgi:hypothetical protein